MPPANLSGSFYESEGKENLLQLEISDSNALDLLSQLLKYNPGIVVSFPFDNNREASYCSESFATPILLEINGLE